MKAQVVTIKPSGEISGLEVKKGFDMKQLGKASVERVSLIVWDEDAQAWFVEFVAGALANTVMTKTAFNRLSDRGTDKFHVIAGRDEVFFKDYDEAVKAEIAMLNEFRLRGIF